MDKLKEIREKIASMEKSSKVAMEAIQEVVANKAGDPLARAIAGAALMMYAESKLDNLRKEEEHLSSCQPMPKGRAAARR